MNVPELSDVIYNRKIFDSNKDFREDILIRLILMNCNFICDFVEFRDYKFGFHSYPHSDYRKGVFNVGVADVNGLFI